jgi:hypothetical protein
LELTVVTQQDIRYAVDELMRVLSSLDAAAIDKRLWPSSYEEGLRGHHLVTLFQEEGLRLEPLTEQAWLTEVEEFEQDDEGRLWGTFVPYSEGRPSEWLVDCVVAREKGVFRAFLLSFQL